MEFETNMTAKAAVISVHDGGNGHEFGDLVEFQKVFHGCLARRSDALFELTDAVLCAAGPVHSLVRLSLVALLLAVDVSPCLDPMPPAPPNEGSAMYAAMVGPPSRFPAGLTRSSWPWRWTAPVGWRPWTRYGYARMTMSPRWQPSSCVNWWPD